jgi:putative transposase
MLEEGGPMQAPQGRQSIARGCKPLEDVPGVTNPKPNGAKDHPPQGSNMPQSFGSLHYHIIFSTKHRHPWITPDIQPRLFEYNGGILENQSCRLVAAGGMPDHVHLLASLARTVAPSDAVRLIKSNSSGWVHDELALRDFAWQTGFGAFTISYSNIAQVKTYLANQEQHHRRVSFQEEFLEFLRRHELEWDERYVWD